MENKQAFIISAVCFVISIILIVGFVKIKRHEMTKEFGEEVEVVVATQDIPEYYTIVPGVDLLEVRKVFKKFKQPQTVSRFEDLYGKATYVPIAKGEQITLTKLIQQDGKPVLDRQVSQSMRALTLLISPHTGVGRMIRPGNHVDVIANPTYEVKGQLIVEVKTIVQNALVLATGKRIQNEVPTQVNREVLSFLQDRFEKRRRKDFYGSTPPVNSTRPDDEYRNITLQLTSEDAEKLLFVTHSFGDQSIYLTLRNAADESVEPIPTTLLDDILGPDSDYGRSKRRPAPTIPKQPKYYDQQGGSPVPVY